MNENQPPDRHATDATGKVMATIAWVLGILVLTQLFGMWEEDQINPNRSLDSQFNGQKLQVVLDVNRKGHYRFTGQINGEPADFLVDTGATDVVIPASLADTYQLESTGQGLGLTANGYVALEKTTIPTLSIGGITLYNVRASLNAAMPSEQPILLGMSALGQLEIEQTQGQMILRQY